ncbi:MAG: tetratricopeptide repeat protein [Deltaproteobacteria bacterium]|jgi:adenylate cyclase|nr:tetratricopeptide repeat protein [Deltaproteobacteria bacterium]
MAQEGFKRKLTAILSADVVGYSRLMDNNEEATILTLKDYHEVMSNLIQQYKGRVVDTTGDNLMAEFASAVDAVNCAVEIQRELAKRNLDLPDDRKMYLRIGVNVGDVVQEGDRIYGDGVNIAARVEALADAGGISISGRVYDQVENKLDFKYEYVGEQAVKNISKPVRLYKVLTQSDDIISNLANKHDLPDKSSIAVLPFHCMSSDQTMEFVSDGLAEDITTLLARIPGFFVISRDSAFAYKNQRIDARQVASDIGVRYVVTGSVREMGKKARVTAELIDGNSGNRLWGDRFDSSKETIFELQDEITRTIASHIEPQLTRAEISRIERRPPENLDVWELYHQAHGLISLKGSNARTYKESISLLRRAIALDPEFAIAHAYLSFLLAFSNLMRMYIGEENLIEQSMESLEKALQLDTRDSIVLGYTGCALCDMGQRQRGLGLLEQAVENDPSNAQAWVAYGAGLLESGRVSDGVEKLKYGIRISPLDGRLAFWGTILAFALFQAGKPDEAAEEARRACRRDDKLPWPRILLAIILTSQGLRDAAEDAMADARRIYPKLRAEKIQPMVGRDGVKILREAGLLD